jgi:predicted MFS family arabinose efflux permease
MALASNPSKMRTWVGFTAMSVGMFMAILDVQIVASSLPEIQAGLAIPLNQAAPVVARHTRGWPLAASGPRAADDIR